MVLVDEIVNMRDLAMRVNSGLIRWQGHPLLPYRIYNYTNDAQIKKPVDWTPAMIASRGLIVNTDTREVVARPFEKFWNYGEEPIREPTGMRTNIAGRLVTVTDKLDGSLGILYPVEEPGEYAIATRGSFTSEQAAVGTAIWAEKYEGRFRPPTGLTCLFEIVYPDNRIVVDYGDTRDLVLLGMVDNTTGVTYGPDMCLYWPGPKAEIFNVDSLTAALSLPPREGQEGVVVHFRDTNQRVKLKQDEYVRLHRIVTGLNPKYVWEYLSTGGNLEELVESVPDNHKDWITDTGGDLYESFFEMEYAVYDEFDTLYYREQLQGRKEFALAIADYESWMKASLFAHMDGKSFDHVVWKQLKPKGKDNTVDLSLRNEG